jgi:hypothetical protein
MTSSSLLSPSSPPPWRSVVDCSVAGEADSVAVTKRVVSDVSVALSVVDAADSVVTREAVAVAVRSPVAVSVVDVKLNDVAVEDVVVNDVAAVEVTQGAPHKMGQLTTIDGTPHNASRPRQAAGSTSPLQLGVVVVMLVVVVVAVVNVAVVVVAVAVTDEAVVAEVVVVETVVTVVVVIVDVMHASQRTGQIPCSRPFPSHCDRPKPTQLMGSCAPLHRGICSHDWHSLGQLRRTLRPTTLSNSQNLPKFNPAQSAASAGKPVQALVAVVVLAVVLVPVAVAVAVVAVAVVAEVRVDEVITTHVPHMTGQRA